MRRIGVMGWRRAHTVLAVLAVEASLQDERGVGISS
jgi:hypothetical protein